MISDERRKMNYSDVTLQIFSGGTPSTSRKDYWGGGINWLSSGETRNRFIYDTENTITEKGVIESSTKLAQKGDTVVASAGQGKTRGQVAFLEIDTYINQSIIAIRPNSKIVEPLWIFYDLSNRYDELRQMSDTSSIRGSLTTVDFKSLKLFVPAFSTQRKIISILKSLDDKIELNRQTNATLEAIAQAIFKEWFVNFNFPGATGELVESELGMIPKGWRVGNLGDFGKIVCGKTPSKTNENFFGGNIPFIKIPDMHNSVFIVETSDTLTHEGALSQKNKFLPPNSIIVSCIATIGLVSLTAKKSQTNQQINAIVPFRDILTHYVYFTAKNIKDQLMELGSGGSATLNVNTSSFSNIKCVIPSEYVLSSFEFLVKPLFEGILANQQEILTIAKCRDELLPKLMNGEIDV